ncbi:hyaluronan-binding protein 2-like [Conger conger]|uniref:hyaluronan-binding protein 2-like n=1 Tax=Conger conger TaxID=82655 RepID=UPI002A599EC0|nr:hyaluronan-binding protein 2-like [Conger conger]
MDSKLLFLLLFSALVVPAQLGKHGHGHGDKHDHGDKHGHGHGHEHEHPRGKNPKAGKWFDWFLSPEPEYDYEATDTPSEEDDSDWLFDLQELPEDECNPNPCLHNGVCEVKKGKFKCDCPRPFKGKRCQKAHKVCRRNRCGHGQCVLTSSHPYYQCKCKDPYQPPDCKKVLLCNPGPCKNGGSCIADGDKFECACPDTFTGKFCQVGPEDCREGNGESYRGQVSETEDGDECLFWNSHFILDQGTDPFTMFEDEDGLGPHNHCRNPDGDVKPWCFIRRKRKLKWDYCNVKECSASTAIPTVPEERGTTASPEEATTASGSAEEVTATGPAEAVTSPPPVHVTTASGSGEHVTPTVVDETGTDEPKTPAPTAKPTEGPVAENQTEFATCGKPQPSRFAQRVYGGMKSIPGAHPWQASVQIRPKGSTWSYQHTCGGVLIKPCWVLTAGHCISSSNSMRVVLGGVDLVKVEPSEQVVEVERVILHENYREAPWAVYNDIALLKLKGPAGHCANETKVVKTACLPPSALPDGTQCTISGWGSTETSDFGSSKLLDAKVLLIAQSRCKSPEVYGDVLDDSMLCAGYLKGGVDSCQGDSGGPLVCEKDEVHYVHGLVSWGDSCGKKNKPGVYTRVTKFTDWIDSHINAA